MSSEARWIPIREELNLIRLTLRDLQQRVEAIAHRLGDRQSSVEIEEEGETAVFGAPEKSFFQFRIVEDGPLDIPQSLVSLARRRLPPYIDFPEDRAKRAWDQAHWAWAAIATETPYTPLEEVPGEQGFHCIILRGPGIEKPFRTTSKKVVSDLVDLEDKTVIFESFKYYVELEIFCSGIPILVPRWLDYQNLL